MIAGMISIKTRPGGSPSPSAPLTSSSAAGASPQASVELTCDDTGCHGFDRLPVGPGASDFYIGPKSLGEPTIDLTLFDTLTRCTTLSSDAKTCVKIEGIAYAPLTKYAVFPRSSIDTTNRNEASFEIGIGTLFADVSRERYISDWGVQIGTTVTVRGHEAIPFTDGLNPALVWEERPGVLVWVTVAPELQLRLMEIAEGVRQVDGPRTIPSRVVVAGTGRPYQGFGNNGDALLIGRSSYLECAGYGFISTCRNGVAAQTFIYERDPNEIRVSGWAPANVSSIRILAPDGTTVTNDTQPLGGYMGRYFATTLAPTMSPSAIEWLDSLGKVVDRAERTPLDPTRREDLLTQWVSWDFALQDRSAVVDPAAPPTS